MTAEDQRHGTLAESTGRLRGDVSSRRARNSRLLGALHALDAATSLSDVLEILARSAGRESLRADVILVGASPASAPELREGCERFSVPLLVGGEVVAVLYADQGSSPVTDASDADEEWPVVIEILARYAARCLETITAFKTARFVAEHTKPAAVRSQGAGVGQAWPPGGQDADEEQAARRYARLLISEIKLYHEAAIVAGRRERDLASRLGGEIARARALYEQRVPDDVRRGTDHFRTELVRTLAGGDASLLGTPQVERGM